MKFQVLPHKGGFLLQTPESALNLAVHRDTSSGPQLKITCKPRISLPDGEQAQAMAAAFSADALVGIVRGVTKGCFYLLVVENSVPIGQRGRFFAQQISRVKAIPFPSQTEGNADRVQIECIEASLHNTPFLYFSHDYNIVQSRQALRGGAGINENRKSQFVWNWKFLEPLYEQNVPAQWIHPIIQGLVAFKPQIRVLNAYFDFVLITRRSIEYQGTRFNCRGLDKQGCAANFAETEQILFFNDPYEGVESSFLQVRGSIPTWWKQEPSLVPKRQCASLLSNWMVQGFELFTHHIQKQLATYGQEIVMVNLIDKQGSSRSSKEQAILGDAFKEHMERYSQQAKGFVPRYVWFDFHHETKKGWSNLSKLLHQVDSEFPKVGFFVASSSDKRLNQRQKGCFRVNCMDNLDRTNVVQSILARKSAFDQISLILNTPNVQSTDDVFNSGFPEFEAAFKAIWADNADAVSLAYAGSKALKTDFTRTGKRQWFGPLQDAVNSLTRLFVNNFVDWYKQDELDILLRPYEEVHDALSKLGDQARAILTPFRRRFGALALLSLGLLTPVGQEHQSAYVALLMGVTSFVIHLQSKERPKLFPRPEA